MEQSTEKNTELARFFPCEFEKKCEFGNSVRNCVNNNTTDFEILNFPDFHTLN